MARDMKRRPPASYQWHGIRLALSECSLHSGSVRYDSEGSIWAVWRFDKNGPWYARVRIGVHRFSGGGLSKGLALSAASTAAQEVLRGLSAAFPLQVSPF